MCFTITRHDPWHVLHVVNIIEMNEHMFYIVLRSNHSTYTQKIGLHTKVKFTAIKNDIRVMLFTTPGRLLISELVPNKCNLFMNGII